MSKHKRVSPSPSLTHQPLNLTYMTSQAQQAHTNILARTSKAKVKDELLPADKARLNDMSHKFYVGDDPAGETKHAPEIPRMKHIEGYAAASEPLPEGIDSVEVIEG